MWKLLYQLASPPLFYRKTQNCLPFLGWSSLLFLSVAFIWGLGFAPADYQQGDAFRIMYLHVPTAFLSISLYAYMAFCALLLLVWRIKIAGLLLKCTAQAGIWMAACALMTGSIWGKPMWGTWWVWDARLTSELILLLLYAAILATHTAFRSEEQADKLIAILTLIGALDLPIIHYSVYWWNTLHQGATLSLFAKPKIAPEMFYPLLFSLVGFFLFNMWIILRRAGNDLLWRERRQAWVSQLVVNNHAF